MSIFSTGGWGVLVDLGVGHYSGAASRSSLALGGDMMTQELM